MYFLYIHLSRKYCLFVLFCFGKDTKCPECIKEILPHQLFSIFYYLQLQNFQFNTWHSSLSVRSVQFSCSVMYDSLQPHEPQQARLPCPSPAPRIYSNSCPLSWWWNLTISSSAIPFSSCLQSFQTPGSFQMIQLFTSDGQSIGVSTSASVFPMNTQDWSA